jgi:hypothetical protein
MDNVFIWRDSVDENYFAIGVKISSGKYYKWMDVFIDAIHECFGEEAYEQAKLLQAGTVYRVQLSHDCAGNAGAEMNDFELKIIGLELAYAICKGNCKWLGRDSDLLCAHCQDAREILAEIQKLKDNA